MVFPLLLEHWVLLVVQLPEQLIRVYDPSQCLGVAPLLESLREFLRNELFFEKVRHVDWRAFQCLTHTATLDPADSGIYILKAVENICRGDFGPVHTEELPSFKLALLAKLSPSS